MEPAGNLTELKPISNERPKSTPASTIPIIFCTTCNKQNHGWAEFGVHIFEDHNLGNFLLAQNAFGTATFNTPWLTTISRQSDPDQEHQMPLTKQWLDNTSVDHRWGASHNGTNTISNYMGPGMDASLSYQTMPNSQSSHVHPNGSGMILYSSERQNPMEMASAGIPLSPYMAASSACLVPSPAAHSEHVLTNATGKVQSTKERNRKEKMATDEAYKRKRNKTERDSKRRQRQRERELKLKLEQQATSSSAGTITTAKSANKPHTKKAPTAPDRMKEPKGMALRSFGKK